MDFVGGLPFTGLQVACLLRLWRVFRELRQIGFRQLLQTFRNSRAESALLSVAFLVMVVLETASILVLATEKSAEHVNIKTASDALWWAYMTITSLQAIYEPGWKRSDDFCRRRNDLVPSSRRDSKPSIDSCEIAPYKRNIGITSAMLRFGDSTLCIVQSLC